MKKQNKNNWVVVGKIGRTHGVKGWVKINSYTEPYTNIMNYHPWYTKDLKILPLVSCEKLGNSLIAQFEHCDTPEKVRPFINQEIWIERSQFADLKKGQYYWADLMGMDVYNKDNTYLGTIKDFMSTGAADIVVIKNNSHEILIPYVVEKYILDIDLDKNIMRVDWDED